MATAKDKAALAAAEKEAAEQAAAEQAAAAAQSEAEQARKDAEEQAAAERAEAETTMETAPSGIMKVFCKLPSGMTFAMPGGDVALKGASGSKLLGGYGVTFMSEPAWEALEARYGGMDVFTKKIIFAEESMKDGAAIAQEMSNEKTGFEGVDPRNPGNNLEPGTR